MEAVTADAGTGDGGEILARGAGEASRRETGPVLAGDTGESQPPSDEAAPDSEVPVEVDVEEISVEIPRSPRTGFPSGFQAVLQHANLHNLLQIESLSRTTGVFLVASQGRVGYLHLYNGDLIHAELGALTGEAAAAEILSWNDGEFKSCSRPLGAATIHSSLQALLLRLARDTDEAAAMSEGRPFVSATHLIEDEKPTEPHLPAPAVDGQLRSSPPLPPRPNRTPPPLPPRMEREPMSRDFMARESTALAEVHISPSGELLQGRGASPDEFSARVAYAARLADLIGRAIRSGKPRALELKGKGTQTTVKWQGDGSLLASLEPIQSPKMR